MTTLGRRQLTLQVNNSLVELTCLLPSLEQGLLDLGGLTQLFVLLLKGFLNAADLTPTAQEIGTCGGEVGLYPGDSGITQLEECLSPQGAPAPSRVATIWKYRSWISTDASAKWLPMSVNKSRAKTVCLWS